MWIRRTIGLSETVYGDLIIEFRCIRSGYRATYWEPGEGPEFEIEDAYFEELHGETWSKGPTEWGDWAPVIDKIVNRVLDDLDIYEEQCNEFDSWGDY